MTLGEEAATDHLVVKLQRNHEILTLVRLWMDGGDDTEKVTENLCRLINKHTGDERYI